MTGALIGSTASTVVIGVVGLSLLDKLSPQEKNQMKFVLLDLKRGSGKTIETVSRRTDIPTGRVQRIMNKAIKAGWVHIANKSQASWRYALTRKGRNALKAL